jgi:hypothetical protein
MMVALSPRDDRGHRTGAIVGMAVGGIFLATLGIQGITA